MVQGGQKGNEVALHRDLRKQLVGSSSGRALKDGRAVGAVCPKNNPGAVSWGWNTGWGMGGFGRCSPSASSGSQV